MPAFKRPAAVGAGGAPPAKKASKLPTKAPEMIAAATPKPQKPAKRSGPMLQVMKGLDQSDLPVEAKAMLEGMLDTSLGVYKDKRDDFQVRAVEMIGGVCSEVEEVLERRVTEAEALIAEDDKAREELDIKVASKLEEIGAKHDEVLTKKRELAEVTQSFLRSREATAEVKTSGKTAEMEAENKLKEKVLLAGILEDFLKPSEEGRTEDLLNRLKNLGISDSMLVALPAVLGKEPSSRGSFDAMVLTSVREELDTRAADIEKAIQNAEPTRAANAETLRKAEAAFEQAREQQMAGADAYWKVHGEDEQLEEHLAGLNKSSRELKQTFRTHSSALSKATRLWGTFQTGPKSAFEGLRDAVEPQAEPTATVSESMERVALEAEVGSEQMAAEA